MDAKPFVALITAALVMLVACNGDEQVVSLRASSPGTPFEIQAWDYATNHFFVDTTYRQYYEDYYQNDPPYMHVITQVVEEEVWVSTTGGARPSDRAGIAFITLPPRPVPGYDTTLRSTTAVPGQIETGSFTRVYRPQYRMDSDGYTGVVSFPLGIPDDRLIAIAYRRLDGAQCGEFASDVRDSSAPLILKMVKPRNLNAHGRNYRVAWDQLLKNIYFMGPGFVRISPVGFALNILFVSPASVPTDRILGQSFLRVLGLDNYNADGTPAPAGDGLFDFSPGRTIDIESGEIILPWLRPFDEGIRTYFQVHMHQLPDTTYFTPGIYDSTKAVAQFNQRYFTINGRTRFFP